MSIWKDQKDLLMLYNSVENDLSALQPFQQLGTISIFVLVPLLSCHFLWTVLMNCTFVNLSFSYKDKFLLEARIKALSCTKLDFVTTKQKIYSAENMFATTERN